MVFTLLPNSPRGAGRGTMAFRDKAFTSTRHQGRPCPSPTDVSSPAVPAGTSAPLPGAIAPPQATGHSRPPRKRALVREGVYVCVCVCFVC